MRYEVQLISRPSAEFQLATSVARVEHKMINWRFT